MRSLGKGMKAHSECQEPVNDLIPLEGGCWAPGWEPANHMPSLPRSACPPTTHLPIHPNPLSKGGGVSSVLAPP